MIFHMVDVVWCRLVRTGVFRGKLAEWEVTGSYHGQTKTQGDLYVLPLASFSKVKLV